MRPHLLILLLITLVLTSCSESSSEDTSSKAVVKLLPPEDGKIYFAAYPAFLEMWEPDIDTVEAERIVTFETLAQKELTWASFSQYWADGITYPHEAIHTIHDEGIIPLVRFEPRSRVDGYIVESVQEELFTLQHIIDGQFDSELKRWAQDAKEDNIPLLIDFGVEVNGGWFPWNGLYNGGGTTDGYGDADYPDGPERFQDAYRHIVQLFRDEGVKHVTWFFHVSMHTTEPADTWNAPKMYYPGDEYVDWIGVSIYGELYPALHYWDTFDDVLQSNDAYKQVLEISQNRPFAILELGVTDGSADGSKKTWLEGAFASIKAKKFIDFRAVNYWHEDWDNNGSMTLLKIDSSVEVLETFQREVADPIFISKGLFSGQ